ncbi:hypothetical protein CIRG_01132 [Coccidioides immitis RMSCC 2394]|uniref:Uncharacterized protein n=1 Tax=Coccidioides immitis RMSCC 2394 TaxID=404692 RepID=A0A0J7AUJ6_COCIT|nr:hypothetical protein CIRG_01132 [Coccidioides immitis RMSCC 2394]
MAGVAHPAIGRVRGVTSTALHGVRALERLQAVTLNTEFRVRQYNEQFAPFAHIGLWQAPYKKKQQGKKERARNTSLQPGRRPPSGRRTERPGGSQPVADRHKG